MTLHLLFSTGRGIITIGASSRAPDMLEPVRQANRPNQPALAALRSLRVVYTGEGIGYLIIAVEVTRYFNDPGLTQAECDELL